LELQDFVRKKKKRLFFRSLDAKEDNRLPLIAKMYFF